MGSPVKCPVELRVSQRSCLCVFVCRRRENLLSVGIYRLSALRSFDLTKFNDRQVSLYYKVGYYSVISYMCSVRYTYQSSSCSVFFFFLL